MIESAYSRQPKKGEVAATWSFALSVISALISFLVCGSNLRGIAYFCGTYAVIAICLGIFVLTSKRQKKKYYAVFAFIFSAIGLAFSYGIMRNVDLCFCPQTRTETSTPALPVDSLSTRSDYSANQLNEQTLAAMVAFYKNEYGENSRLEAINSDTLIEMTFYSIPNDTDDYEGALITISIPKVKESSSVIRGDINSDKSIDILISVPTEGGGGGGNIAWSDHFLFLGAKNGGFVLSDVKSDGALTGCGGGHFTPETMGINSIVGTSLCYADTDGHCCPSLKFRSTVTFNDGELTFSEKKPIP